MHLLSATPGTISDGEEAIDLDQPPGDIVILTVADSDLACFAAAAARLPDDAPTVRLANLLQLKHPYSVDLYVEKVIAKARFVCVILLGGKSYWPYGVDEIAQVARERGIAFAAIADGREGDPALDRASTVPAVMREQLRDYLRQGGTANALSFLRCAARLTGADAGEPDHPLPIADAGLYLPGHDRPGVAELRATWIEGRPVALLIFYRALVVAGTLSAVDAMVAALQARGFNVAAVHVRALREPFVRDWLGGLLADIAPDIIVNATSFAASSSSEPRVPGILEQADCPILQTAFAGVEEGSWRGSARGLGPRDLAMNVALPEVDGRLFTRAVAFKAAERFDARTHCGIVVPRVAPDRVAFVADLARNWAALRRTAPAQRRVALVLANYPNRDGRIGNGVGLDTPASAAAILCRLGEAGYAIGDAPRDGAALMRLMTGSVTNDRASIDRLGEVSLSLDVYRAALTALPASARDAMVDRWGTPEADPFVRDGAFRLAVHRFGHVAIAVQPARGYNIDPKSSYHDPALPPPHAYFAFHVWLEQDFGAQALVHVGKHGNLEWLPGKAVSLSADCFPEICAGPVPQLYPFIVNDPGEAAQAKRRLGAVTIGHVPPALVQAGTGAGLGRLEALLDEYANADGLDPARRDRLRALIAEEAESVGLGETLGLAGAEDPLVRIDAFVCDVKDSQFGEGLHVFGRGEQGAAERAGLLAGLNGQRVAAGPSGSPYRGRADVLPTGRNLYAIDPRAVPSRAAQAQGVKLAEELLRRHMQEEGDYLRTLIVDLWGSATMRTAGEEFAMALHLIGVEPVWDHRSERVTGFEVMPLMRFDRPRVDVTLRVSGLFRDAFPHLVALFGQAVRALGQRDEAPDWNPFVGQATPRVYGPAPGRYGVGLDPNAGYDEAARIEAGQSWLAASATALDDGDRRDADGIAARVAGAQAFVHLHDLPESDLLLAADYAAHQAGFAAARAALEEGAASLYHLDTRDPAHPNARTLAEEIARTVHARVANPRWVEGMMRHGFRGAAEIAATLDHLGSFAHLADAVPAALIDLYWDATLAQDAVRDFMAQANPAALAAMEARFAALHAAGLWRTRRNSVLAMLAGAA